MRTPMNAIIGMTTIGRRAVDVARKDYALDKIEDASTHLLGIISDVLDMAKIEADKLELSPIEFCFTTMLQSVVSVINFRVEEKRQHFSTHVDDKVPQYVVGDAQRLAQIIMNLLSNAVKFTPEGGDIHLEASMAGGRGNLCELRIEVADTGIGISPEQQSRLFHAFEQAESGTSRKFGGTGLGLSISKRIVELMDGRIWVESSLGVGSRFIFTVKLGRSDGEALPETLIPPVGGDAEGNTSEGDDRGNVFPGKRILVAEDVDINREVLLALLDGTGLHIDCAENGREAVELVMANPDFYDLVLMDMQMPEMDGLEATRRIRTTLAQQEKKLPIIAMTANVFKSDIEDCLAAGMDAHIGKPLNLDEILHCLNKYLYPRIGVEDRRHGDDRRQGDRRQGEDRRKGDRRQGDHRQWEDRLQGDRRQGEDRRKGEDRRHGEDRRKGEDRRRDNRLQSDRCGTEDDNV